MALPFKHPFTCITGGPTSCGKTVFVSKFLQNIDVMIDQKIEEIIWCFGESQPMHEELKNSLSTPIKFIEGIPNLNDIASESKPPARLIVIDDFMREADGKVVDIFSKGSHHRNLSIIFITQNIFFQGKGARDMSLNAHYLVIFKNPRDRSQFQSMARQIYPENTKFITEAYADATSKPHSYLLLDMRQSTPDAFRFRTEIFPGENQFVYIPKRGGASFSSYIV
jgi:hypothetical protein